MNIHENLSKEQIYDCLIRQNSVLPANSSLEVVHVARSRSDGNGSAYTAYIETNGSCFAKLLQVGFVYVGWDKCKIYEDLKLMR